MEFYGGWLWKGPCDHIEDVAKRKADQAVKNGKYVIQGATDFFEWVKQDTSAIAFSMFLLKIMKSLKSF